MDKASPKNDKTVAKDLVNCKYCNFSGKSVLQHSVANKHCRDKYTDEEIIDLRQAQKRKRNEKDRANYSATKRAEKHKKNYDPEKRAQMHRATYDPEKSKLLYDPNKSKESYDPEKRKQKYKNEKARNIPYEEIKALKADRDKEAQKARYQNSQIMKEACRYFRCGYMILSKLSEEKLSCKIPCEVSEVFDYIDELQDLPLSKDAIAKLSNVLKQFSDIHTQIEREIDEMYQKAIMIRFLKDLREFYSQSMKAQSKRWKSTTKEAESIFVAMADHVEDYNNYRGSFKTEPEKIGELRIPKYKSCTKDESCRSCKKATLDDQEKFEENARKRNLKYFKYAELYLEVCEKEVKHLKLTQEFLKQINEIQNELKQQHLRIENEINKAAIEAKCFDMWRDLDKFYGKVDVLFLAGQWSTPFGNDHVYDKPFILEEWKITLSNIEKLFYKVAVHVQRFTEGTEFGILLKPQGENPFSPCNEKERCQKCLGGPREVEES